MITLRLGRKNVGSGLCGYHVVLVPAVVVTFARVGFAIQVHWMRTGASIEVRW